MYDDDLTQMNNAQKMGGAMRNYFPIDHMAATDEPIYSQSAEDYKALDNEEIPLHDLYLNNESEWFDFCEAHLAAYPDFKRWLYTAFFKGDVDYSALVRIIDRAIKELE